MVKKEYEYQLCENPLSSNKKDSFDAIILAVAHQEYLNYSEESIRKHLSPNGVFADVKGTFRGKFEGLNYWSL